MKEALVASVLLFSNITASQQAAVRRVTVAVVTFTVGRSADYKICWRHTAPPLVRVVLIEQKAGRSMAS